MSSFFGQVQSLNFDLIVPCIIVFAVLRTSKAFPVKHFILHGLRVFVPSADRLYTQKRATAISADEVEISQSPTLQLTLIELDHSIQKNHLVSQLNFFGIFENMVNISLSILLSHCSYISYHCFHPSANYSFWGGCIALGVILVSLHCSLKVLVMTDWKSFETRTGIFFGATTMVISYLCLLGTVDILKFGMDEILYEIAIHINELIKQMAADPPQFPIQGLISALRINISLLIGILCACMVPPALRFGQPNVGYLHVSLVQWIDQILPLATAIVLTPSLQPIIGITSYYPQSSASFHEISVADPLHCVSASSSSLSNECTNSSTGWIKTHESLLCLQLFLLSLMVIFRFMCLKSYLQSHLNTSVHAVASQIHNGGFAVAVGFTKIMVRKCCNLSTAL